MQIGVKALDADRTAGNQADCGYSLNGFLIVAVQTGVPGCKPLLPKNIPARRIKPAIGTRTVSVNLFAVSNPETSGAS